MHKRRHWHATAPLFVSIIFPAGTGALATCPRCCCCCAGSSALSIAQSSAEAIKGRKRALGLGARGAWGLWLQSVGTDTSTSSSEGKATVDRRFGHVWYEYTPSELQPASERAAVVRPAFYTRASSAATTAITRTLTADKCVAGARVLAG